MANGRNATKKGSLEKIQIHKTCFRRPSEHPKLGLLLANTGNTLSSDIPDIQPLRPAAKKAQKSTLKQLEAHSFRHHHLKPCTNSNVLCLNDF